ncbi:metalloregulator ArsR/SmtB family transcription factor [Endozoicomonas sp. G2_2]|uniref:metalloregulator ArsR/SmtB family transcription factor n=1 Tax=Endozoicomonas sp. G2_2 TaxID=2821092 RepID=UPI001AD983AF|nr:metalloregulator ArsR/SmtB family transcription factor [Endozoicomonas sp. G2_2]MBO9469354.1 metalloregulator ArsR/SmtB family transcription factor [Endozoicomonas sp. G2_2]
MNAATADATTAAVPEAIFQALADSTRLRCLALIVNHGELCVCELVHALELSQPKISRHLKLLREAGLVADRRERIWVHYRLSDTLPLWARRTLGDVVAAHAHDAPFAGDARRLAHMPDRPEGRCDS